MERVPITVLSLDAYKFEEAFDFPIAVSFGKRALVPSVRVFVNSYAEAAVILEKKNGVRFFRTDWVNGQKVEYMDQLLEWYMYKKVHQLPTFIKMAFWAPDPYGHYLEREPTQMARDAGFTLQVVKIDYSADCNCFIFNADGFCLGFIRKGVHGNKSLLNRFPKYDPVYVSTEEEFEGATWNEKLKMFLIK